MDRRYKIFEVMADGTKRLMTVATIRRQAIERLVEIRERFKDRTFILEVFR
jgi:hypothetical protein